MDYRDEEAKEAERLQNETFTDKVACPEMPYEYGTMSSKFKLMAADKRTAYATMCLHYQRNSHLIAIYSPESSKEDSWMSFNGKVSKKLDKVFGGEGFFDSYLQNNIDAIRKCYKSITRLI